jgi:hypothetical protein
MKYKINEQSFIARIAAWNLRSTQMAIVIGNTIHLHNVSKKAFLDNKSWFRHELTHIQQFKSHGYICFVCKYLYESIKHGYHNNKYEIEARNAELNEDFFP